MAQHDDDLAALAEELSSVAERLADLALERLRRATDPDEPNAAEAERTERRITRARRAVQKAATLLAGPGDSDLEGV
jgi:hypothetical protein